MTADRRKQIPKKIRVIVSARISPQTKRDLLSRMRKSKHKNLSETVEQAIKHYLMHGEVKVIGSVTQTVPSTPSQSKGRVNG